MNLNHSAKNVFAIFSVLGLALLLGGCLHILNPKVIKNAQIIEQHKDGSCPGFSLDAQGVEDFFIHANPTTSVSNLHDSATTRHCYAQGTGHKKKQSCQWEIRSEGTGVIQCPDKTYEFVCHKCF